nr:retrovirus-related Pol polyprotein from transposon TNT 1-94 [Tanacetum cinerariifolium]
MVNASQVDMINGLLSKSDHEQRHYEKLETIIHTSANDQIDFDIIFDDPHMDNNKKLDLPSKKMPNESKLLKLFVYIDNEIKELGKLIDDSLQMEKERTVIYDEKNETRRYFTKRQFCDGDLEVGFRSNTCYVRNLEVEDLLTGSRDSNLYTISIYEMAAASPVCLMSKVTSAKLWLWHRRLSHLNFGTINHLTKQDLVDGLLRFKPMRVETVNGKRYILVIVDDYSRYTWVYFLWTKDETEEMIITFITDEVFSTWMAFGGNTCDLGSFGEETDKTTTLHQEP